MYVVLGMYDRGFKSLKYYQIQYLSSFLYREAHPSRQRHELTNHLDRVTEIGSGDCQVYKAYDNLSEPPRIRAKLNGSIQRGRDGLTIGHSEFEEHTQHVMLLVDQYAFGGMNHFDPEELMKVPQILHVE